jgi:hypothetical protein
MSSPSVQSTGQLPSGGIIAVHIFNWLLPADGAVMSKSDDKKPFFKQINVNWKEWNYIALESDFGFIFE